MAEALTREALIDMLADALPHVQDAGDDVTFTKDARAGFKRLAARMRAAIEAETASAVNG